MKLPEFATICEVGPRDGLQNEKKILTTEERLSLVKGAIESGFRVVEVGSFVHPKAVPQMANTDEIFRELGEVKGVELRALIANMKGVERAAACGCRKVKLNVSASLGHNMANLNCTPEESVARFKDMVNAAHDAGIEASGSISMAFGSPWDDLILLSQVKKITEAYLEAGVTEISLSDASGQAFPKQVSGYCEEMGREYPEVKWWLHFHNTRGLAMANILAGLEAGFTRFDASFAGVGGCPFVPGATGNVATEDVIHMLDGIGVETGVDIGKCVANARHLREIIGHETDSYILKAGRAGDLKLDLPVK